MKDVLLGYGRITRPRLTAKSWWGISYLQGPGYCCRGTGYNIKLLSFRIPVHVLLLFVLVA